MSSICFVILYFIFLLVATIMYLEVRRARKSREKSYQEYLEKRRRSTHVAPKRKEHAMPDDDDLPLRTETKNDTAAQHGIFEDKLPLVTGFTKTEPPRSYPRSFRQSDSGGESYSGDSSSSDSDSSSD